MKPKNPSGRPKSPETMNDRILIRTKTASRCNWQDAADKMGVNLTTWIRLTLDRAAKK